MAAWLLTVTTTMTNLELRRRTIQREWCHRNYIIQTNVMVRTSTHWIDAEPITTSSMPSIPTGYFNVPADDLHLNSDSCIEESGLSSAWACLASGSLPIYISPDGPFGSITLQSNPITADFVYGPQPPNLQSQGGAPSPIPLFPFLDRNAVALGPSLFFFTTYDKLTIGMPSLHCCSRNQAQC